jgi:methionyl-tRNA formyltransferase
VVDWSLPAPRVHNLIRGADPSPGASTVLNGETLGLFGSTIARQNAGSPPGTVEAVSVAGIEIACAEGGVSIAKIRPASTGKKIAAAEWAATAGIKPSDRLGR